MKKKLLTHALLVMAGIALCTEGALAIPFEMGDASTVTGSALSDPGLAMSYQIADLDSIVFDLDAGESYSFLFAKFWTTENWVNADDLVPQSIQADIDFDSPTTTASVLGQSVGGRAFLGLIQGWGITWNDPVLVNFETGGQFAIELSNAFFHEFLSPSGRRTNGDDVWATVTVNTAPVPEPSVLLLFGAVSLGAAGIARRRKSKDNIKID